MEKQLSTPEYYPLTLNALSAACNQKSNREPVMHLDETSILKAVDSLRERNLVYLHYGSTSRTVKYKHMLPSVYGIDQPATAILAVLILRGPQTAGELRERTGRMFEFSSIPEVAEKLEELALRESDPLVVKLERQPGHKESRFAHLLSPPAEAAAAPAGGAPDKKLEDRVRELEEELERFRTEFAEFRKQFD